MLLSIKLHNVKVLLQVGVSLKASPGAKNRAGMKAQQIHRPFTADLTGDTQRRTFKHCNATITDRRACFTANTTPVQ